jgi:hypothetical protein
MSTTPHQQPAQTPIFVINNSVSAMAVAGRHGRRRQSPVVHFWLLLLTAGVGNVVYAVNVSRWNRNHGF